MSIQRPSNLKKLFAALAGRRESGQALVEYGLILTLVSLVAIGLTPVGQLISTKLTEIASAI